MNRPPTSPPTVPAWVDDRLEAIFSAAPVVHFEHSIYGPLTSYLHTFFPPDRSFMIKPQGMLRPDLDGDSDVFRDISAQEPDLSEWAGDKVMEWAQGLDEGDGGMDSEVMRADIAAPAPWVSDGLAELEVFQNMSDDDDFKENSEGEPDRVPGPDTSYTSNDSYGMDVKRTNKGIRYPDFIIVKATKNLTDDTILLIVEVKKDCDSKDAARLQMYEYLGMAASKRRAKALQGLLIMGAKSECCHLDSRRESGISAPISLLTTSPRLKAKIHKIAVDNWQ